MANLSFSKVKDLMRVHNENNATDKDLVVSMACKTKQSQSSKEALDEIIINIILFSKNVVNAVPIYKNGYK